MPPAGQTSTAQQLVRVPLTDVSDVHLHRIDDGQWRVLDRRLPSDDVAADPRRGARPSTAPDPHGPGVARVRRGRDGRGGGDRRRHAGDGGSPVRSAGAPRARLGLGALGVISTVTLQCEPSYALAAQERPEPLEDVLANFERDAASNDHFEFYWFPYGNKALVKRNNRLPSGTATKPLSRVKEYIDYELTENVAFGALCRLGRAVPKLVRPLGKLSSNVLSAREYSDVSHKVFVTARSVRFVES